MTAEPVIEVAGLSRSFGPVRAVDDVSFTVERGSVFGLLGPNGAGKTTVIRLLTTLLRPDAGSARILGIDVRAHPGRIRQVIGLAGQAAAVDPNLTGRENLRLIGRLGGLRRPAFRRRSEQLLIDFDLMAAAKRPVRTCSGGMRRRLDIAAALVTEPPVLFLDEPTTGLDLISRTRLWQLIRSLVERGTTVVLTTQYLEEADRLSDRIAIINQGRLVADDTPAALKTALGGAVIELRFDNEVSAQDAARLLGGRLALAVTTEHNTVLATAADGSTTAIPVLRLLDERHLAPIGLAVRSPTLDDAFLRLTGRLDRVPSALEVLA